jgi:hypothetical protein
MGTARTWIDALPDSLCRQRRVIGRLLDWCEQTDDARWYAVSCSLARGAGDELSDVDAGIGVRDGRIADLTEDVRGFLAQDSAIVDVLGHAFGPADRPGIRSFVQFADGTQLDLVVMPDGIRAGHAPDEIVLCDKDGRLAESFVPRADIVTPEHIREWAFLGWIALADASKYLRRGSYWEAHNRLHEVRGHIWALWGAARGARYPVFGLSQVLDHDPDDLPAGIAETTADLDPDHLRRALTVSVAVLDDVSRAAARKVGGDLPTAMAEYVAALWAAPQL